MRSSSWNRLMRLLKPNLPVCPFQGADNHHTLSSESSFTKQQQNKRKKKKRQKKKKIAANHDPHERQATLTDQNNAAAPVSELFRCMSEQEQNSLRNVEQEQNSLRSASPHSENIENPHWYSGRVDLSALATQQRAHLHHEVDLFWWVFERLNLREHLPIECPDRLCQLRQRHFAFPFDNPLKPKTARRGRARSAGAQGGTA